MGELEKRDGRKENKIGGGSSTNKKKGVIGKYWHTFRDGQDSDFPMDIGNAMIFVVAQTTSGRRPAGVGGRQCAVPRNVQTMAAY